MICFAPREAAFFRPRYLSLIEHIERTLAIAFGFVRQTFWLVKRRCVEGFSHWALLARVEGLSRNRPERRLHKASICLRGEFVEGERSWRWISPRGFRILRVPMQALHDFLSSQPF